MMHTDDPKLQPLYKFFSQTDRPRHTWPLLTYIDQHQLPEYAHFLLTQPLLTQSVTDYFQRSPKILPPLYQETDNQHYYRAIAMIIDKKPHRDDALLAHTSNESFIMGLGFIMINFSALPPIIIDAILQSATPFGGLLLEHQIETRSLNTHHFKIKANASLMPYLSCQKVEFLYGRCNTLVQAHNKTFIAQVVEILNHDEECIISKQ